MHYFTPDEANAALERVRPLAEQMVERRRAMLAAQAREEELGARVAGNGGGIDPGEPARTEAVVEDDLPPAWYKDALVVAPGAQCNCC